MDADGWQSSAFLLSYIHKRKKPLYEPLLVHRNNFVLHLSIYFILWRHPYIHPTKTCWWSAGWLTVYIWVFVRSFPSLQVHWMGPRYSRRVINYVLEIHLNCIPYLMKWNEEARGIQTFPLLEKYNKKRTGERIIASATLWGVMNSTLNITPQFLTVG